MGKPVIIDSDVLRYLAKEHLALQKEVEIEAKATIIACEYCAYQIENFAVCDSCKVRETCPCNGCGGDSKNFEWRGVVEANEPDEEEVTEFMKKLIEKEGE